MECSNHHKLSVTPKQKQRQLPTKVDQPAQILAEDILNRIGSSIQKSTDEAMS
jgi:hypothetical protein